MQVLDHCVTKLYYIKIRKFVQNYIICELVYMRFYKYNLMQLSLKHENFI